MLHYGLIKLSAGPIGAAWLLLSDTTSLSNLPVFLGVALVIVGAMMVGRFRSTLELEEKARAAIAAERDALGLKADRLQSDLSQAESQIRILEARPSLDQHAELLRQLTELVSEQIGILQDRTRYFHILEEIRSAVIPHD